MRYLIIYQHKHLDYQFEEFTEYERATTRYNDLTNIDDILSAKLYVFSAILASFGRGV